METAIRNQHALPEFIPCNFIGILYRGKDKTTSKPVWEVKKDEFTDYELYVPDDSAVRTFRDAGEKFFVQKKYEEVIKYYKTAGINQPWATFFIGKALYEMANDDWKKVLIVTEHYDDDAVAMVRNFNEQDWKNNYLTVDVPLVTRRLDMAQKMFSAYNQTDGA